MLLGSPNSHRKFSDWTLLENSLNAPMVWWRTCIRIYLLNICISVLWFWSVTLLPTNRSHCPWHLTSYPTFASHPSAWSLPRSWPHLNLEGQVQVTVLAQVPFQNMVIFCWVLEFTRRVFFPDVECSHQLTVSVQTIFKGALSLPLKFLVLVIHNNIVLLRAACYKWLGFFKVDNNSFIYPKYC